MSQQNVEIVRAVCDAFSRGDFEASLAGLDPAVEMVGPPDLTASGSASHGHESTSQFMGTFLNSWDDYFYDVSNLIDGGDKVLVEGSQGGRGRESGVAVSEPIYTVFTVRAGKVIRVQILRDRSAALEAAGLPE